MSANKCIGCDMEEMCDMDEMIKKNEKVIKTDCVYKGNFLTLMREEVEWESGKKKTREYLLHPGAAVVVPELPDGRLLLIKQYRFALNGIFWEFPAGKRDPPEEFITTAGRELLEETGYKSNNIQFMTRIHPVIGYSTEVMELFLATDLEWVGASPEDGEHIELHPRPPHEIEELIWSGAVSDVKTQLAYFWYKQLRKRLMPGAKTSEIAIFAGGCFWGLEELFAAQKGVIETEVGYTGGDIENPTYDLVKKGMMKKGINNHAESVKIIFDPSITSYENLLEYFFRIHDPTTLNQQGNDVGIQYRSAIFYTNEQQKEIAEQVIKKLEDSKVWEKPITTILEKEKKFWPAEEYHQDYLKKNPGGYTCHFERKRGK